MYMNIIDIYENTKYVSINAYNGAKRGEGEEEVKLLCVGCF